MHATDTHTSRFCDSESVRKRKENKQNTAHHKKIIIEHTENHRTDAKNMFTHITYLALYIYYVYIEEYIYVMYMMVDKMNIFFYVFAALL